MFTGTLFFAFLYLLHIPNNSVSVSFASIPIAQQNLFIQNPSFGELSGCLLNISTYYFTMSFELTKIIFKKNPCAELKKEIDVYHDEMSKRDLVRDNVRITLTVEQIRANRLSTSFIPVPESNEVAERMVVGAEPTTADAGPFLQYHNDSNDVTNVPVSVLEALVKDFQVPLNVGNLEVGSDYDFGSLVDVMDINLGFESDYLQ